MSRKGYLTKKQKNMLITKLQKALDQLQNSLRGDKIVDEGLALTALAMIATLLSQLVGDHEHRFMSIKDSLN